MKLKINTATITDLMITVLLQVDFSTMTHNVEDAEMETDPAMEREYIRTAEAATCITKDTGKPCFLLYFTAL